jgi:hypothetical protein
VEPEATKASSAIRGTNEFSVSTAAVGGTFLGGSLGFGNGCLVFGDGCLAFGVVGVVAPVVAVDTGNGDDFPAWPAATFFITARKLGMSWK